MHESTFVFVLNDKFFGLLVDVSSLPLQVGVLSPQSVPYEYLGPVGDFLHYVNYGHPFLIKVILVATCGIHVLEGCYAFILTR